MAARRIGNRKSFERRADSRSAMQRRFDDLMLAGIIGRQRPQWAGERSEQLFNETADLVLPWQYTPDEPFLLAGEEP